MIITTETLQAINKGFQTTFWDAYHGAKEGSLTETLALRSTSKAAEEIYGWLGAIPGLRELVGEIEIANILEHAYRIPNKEFERTIAVKRASIERDTLGTYTPLLTAIGIAAAEHADELLVARMIGGFTELCYTGLPFFALNHEPKKGGVKFSNLTTKKLSRDNFRTAREAIQSRLNYEGRPMNLGRKLVLVVSPKNQSLALEITAAEKVAGGDSNVDKGTATAMVINRLAANPDMWFLFDLGWPVKPFINQIELETEFTSLDNPRDHHVFFKKEYLHQAYRRGNVGFGMPETAYGSTGVDAA